MTPSEVDGRDGRDLTMHAVGLASRPGCFPHFAPRGAVVFLEHRVRGAVPRTESLGIEHGARAVLGVAISSAGRRDTRHGNRHPVSTHRRAEDLFADERVLASFGKMR